MDNINMGEMAEWLKAPAWKACILLKVSRVRIPFSPPKLILRQIIFGLYQDFLFKYEFIKPSNLAL